MDVIIENIPEENTESSEPRANSGVESLEHLALSQRYGIDTPTKYEDKQLRELWDYGKQLSKTGDTTDIIWQIMHLQATLGAPRYGEKILDKVYRYVNIKRQVTQLEDELRTI